MDAIYAENLTKKYGDNEVLKEVNLKIEEGEFYVLMGPNGSGKTTLASIMASVRSRACALQEDHNLVTTGPYRWVRHPMYTVHIVYFFT